MIRHRLLAVRSGLLGRCHRVVHRLQLTVAVVVHRVGVRHHDAVATKLHCSAAEIVK